MNTLEAGDQVLVGPSANVYLASVVEVLPAYAEGERLTDQVVVSVVEDPTDWYKRGERIYTPANLVVREP
jgi:hypothetical protein